MKTRWLHWTAGLLTLLAIDAEATVRYVNVNNTNPLPPYGDWSSAATNIQDAIDAANPGDQILVTNGVYQTGGRVIHGIVTNRVAINKAVVVQSVNGPQVTLIRGYQITYITNIDAVRCVYLADGATLAGFTLTNGGTVDFGTENRDHLGAGVLCDSTNATVTDCVLVGNLTYGQGGGACYGTLNRCILTDNSALLPPGALGAGFAGGGAVGSVLNQCLLKNNRSTHGAGAAYFCTLNNCTVVSNSTEGIGGGTYGGTLKNCIIYYNTDRVGDTNYSGGTLNYCCTLPQPGSAGNNLTNAPRFVDVTGGNFHLQSNSPCINSGNNSYVTSSTDLDGNPRLAGGTVDIGAYEFQSPGSVLPYAWLQKYHLPIDGTADFTDLDADGMNNWQEWRAGTEPDDPSSVLRMLPPSFTDSGVSITWQSVIGRQYFLERSTDLTAQPAFLTLQSNIPAFSNLTTCTDTSPGGDGPVFYRVGVQP